MIAIINFTSDEFASPSCAYITKTVFRDDYWVDTTQNVSLERHC